MGNSKSLPKSKSADTLPPNKKKMKSKKRAAQEAHASMSELTSGAVPYNNKPEEDVRVDFKLYQSYGDLNFTPSDSFPDLKYYKRSSPAYRSMPRNRRSDGVYMNGTRDGVVKRHLSDRSTLTPTKHQMVRDLLDTPERSNPVSDDEDVQFPDFQEISRKIRLFQETYQIEFAKQFAQLDCTQCLARIEIAQSLIKPHWVVSVLDYLEDEDTCHMVERMLEQEDASMTLPKSFFATVQNIRTQNNKEKHLWLPLARDIIDSIAKETSQELGRIYEYQIAMLEPDRSVVLLAKHAVMKVYLAVTQKNVWLERNSVLRTVVMTDANNMEGTRMTFSVLIGGREYKWPIHNILLRPGIRRDCWQDNGLCSSYHWDNKRLDPKRFGFRGVLYEWDYGNKCYCMTPYDNKYTNSRDHIVFRDIHQGYTPYRRVLGKSAVEQYLKTTSGEEKQRISFRDFVNENSPGLTPAIGADLQPAFSIRCEEDIDTTNWQNTDWDGVDLTRLQIPHVNLSGASVRGACLMYANLEFTDMHNTNISFSDLSYSDLTGAQVCLSDLHSTKASYTNIGDIPTIKKEDHQEEVPTLSPLAALADSGFYSAADGTGRITNSKGSVKDISEVLEEVEKRGRALARSTPPSKPSRSQLQDSPDSGIARSEKAIQPVQANAVHNKPKSAQQSRWTTGNSYSPVTKVERASSDSGKKSGLTDSGVLDKSESTNTSGHSHFEIDTFIDADRSSQSEGSPEKLAPLESDLYRIYPRSTDSDIKHNTFPRTRKDLYKKRMQGEMQNGTVPGKASAVVGFISSDQPQGASLLASGPRQREQKIGDRDKRISLATEAAQQELVTRSWLASDPKRRSFPLMKAPVPMPETSLSRLEGDLPAIVPHFIGRNSEVRQICKSLGQDRRFVVLHGDPAVGKSSVAIAAAHEARMLLGTAVFYATVRGTPTTRTVLLKFMDQLGLRLNLDDKAMFYNWMNSHKDKVLFVVDDANHFKGDPKDLAKLIDELLQNIPNLSVLLCGTESKFLGQSGHDLLKVAELEDGGGDLFQSYTTDISLKDAKEYASLCGENPVSISLVARALNAGALNERDINKYLDASEHESSVENMAARVSTNQIAVPSLLCTTRAILAVIESLQAPEKRLLRNLTMFPASFNQAAVEELDSVWEEDGEMTVPPLTRLMQLGLVLPSPGDRFVLLDAVRKIAIEHLGGRTRHQERYMEIIIKQLENIILMYHSHEWVNSLKMYRYIRDDVECILGRIPSSLVLFESLYILEVTEGAMFLYEVLPLDLYRRTYLNLLELAVSIDKSMDEMSVECCLAYAHIKERNFKEAAIHADRAFDILKTIKDNATPSYKSFCLLIKGIVLANEKKSRREAMDLVKTALDIEKDTIKLKRALTLHTYEEYAKMNKEIGRMPTARHYYNIADYIIGELCGHHPHLLEGYGHRMSIWDSMLLFNRATDVARIAVEVAEKAFSEHPITADAHANLCECILKRGTLVDAFDAAASAFSIRKRLLGTHRDTALSHKTMAYLYLRMGDSKNALEHSQRGLEMMRDLKMDRKYLSDMQNLLEQVKDKLKKDSNPVVQIEPMAPKGFPQMDTTV